MKMPEERTVRYWATSVVLSKTFWVNVPAFVIAFLALPEVVGIIPLAWLPFIGMLTAGYTLYLRRFSTVRPVRLIMPGETKPVDVPKLGPPPPGVTG